MMLSIQDKIKFVLADELDDDFPNDLSDEFWTNMKTIASLWVRNLRSETINELKSLGYSVEWFKWGYSPDYPVLVIKLDPSPNSNKVWEIADNIVNMLSNKTGIKLACLIHL